MTIHVEFYGVPRLRAGVRSAEVDVGEVPTLGGVLMALRERFPELAEYCFVGERLHPTLTANVDGQRFVRDPQTQLAADATVLLLSTDAGG